MDKQKQAETLFLGFQLKKAWAVHFGSQRGASEALLLKMQFRTKDRRKMKPKD